MVLSFSLRNSLLKLYMLMFACLRNINYKFLNEKETQFSNNVTLLQL